MEITSVYPLILTPKAEETVALFEELGFERRHKKEGIEGDVSSTSMKDANGFRIAITQVDQMPQAMTAVQVSVQGFEEAYELLQSKGFKNAQGDHITDTGTSKSTMMVSPTGFAITLSEHQRK